VASCWCQVVSTQGPLLSAFGEDFWVTPPVLRTTIKDYHFHTSVGLGLAGCQECSKHFTHMVCKL
jgi:hypothetical protein